MIPYIIGMENQNMAEITPDGLRGEDLRLSTIYTLKYQPGVIKVNGLTPETIQASTIMAYLIKAKQWDVIKDYADALEFTDPSICFVMMLYAGEDNIDLLRWTLNRVNINLEEYPRLYSWLFKNVKEPMLKAIDDFYQNRLLDNEINYL